MNEVFYIGRDDIPRKVVLGEGEKLFWTLVYLPGSAPAQVNLDIDLAGPGAQADIAGVYLCPQGEILSLGIRVSHLSGGCSSRQLFKGIAGEGSRVSFDGLIYVARDSQKTKAYQESHTILLSDKALVTTSPQLEIYADDVECSHGATTGFLNADEEFYMRSRGIPEQEARRLQIISFLAPVLGRLPEESRYDILP